jgi:hypothetical protein
MSRDLSYANQAEWNPGRGDRRQSDVPAQRDRYLRRLETIRRIKSAALLTHRGRSIVRGADALALAREVEFELQLKGRTRWGKVLEEPSLVFSSIVALPGQELPQVSVFAKTTKMRCASFSLPVGPPKSGGTCVQADRQKLMRSGEQYICHACYAASGNYLYSSQQFRQAVRRRWVEDSLEDRTFVEQMSAALEAFVARPRLGINRRCFRIHDAGDFAWAGADYFCAWTEICDHFSRIKFWAPTRDWVSPTWARLMSDRPVNLVIRPSALHLGGACFMTRS